MNKIDIFGSQIGFNYNRDQQFKTKFGGIISIAFVCFVGIFFYSQIVSFLKRGILESFFHLIPLFQENVTSISSKEFAVDPPKIVRTKQEFMFAIKLDQTNADFLKNPLFNITWEQREYTTFPNGTKNKTTYPMQFEPCTLEHWTGLPTYGNVNWTQQFYDGGLADFLCPRINDALQFGGSYSVYAYEFIKVQIKPCTNSNDPTRLWQPICKNSTEVTNYFKKTQSVTIMFRMNNYVINPNDPINPIRSYIEDSIFFPVQPGTAYQTADIYLTENNVTTDRSILPFKDLENKQLLLYNGGNYRLQYVIGNTSTTVADFFLRKDPISILYNRQFTKISNIAASIGGFCQTFIIICAILVHYYNGYLCTLELANKLYDFDVGDKSHPSKNNKQVEKQAELNNILTKQNQFCEEKNIKLKNLNDLKSESFQNKTIENTPVFQQSNKQQIHLIAPLSSQNIERAPQSAEVEHIQGFGYNLNSAITITRPDSPKLPILCRTQDNTIENAQIQNDDTHNQIYSAKSPHEQRTYFYHQQIQKVSIDENDYEIFPETPMKQKKVQSLDFKQPNGNSLNEKQQEEGNKSDNNFYKGSESIVMNEKSIQQNEQYQSKNQSMNEKTGNTLNIDYKPNLKSQLEKSKEKEALKLPSESKSKKHIGNMFFQDEEENKTKIQNEKEYLQKEFINYFQKDNTLKLSYKYFIYKLSCGKFCKSSQMVLLDRAKEMMDKEMDIAVILNNIKEMSKLKDLLLDKDQQILFNFFPKPQISINDTKKIISRADLESKKDGIYKQMDKNKKQDKKKVEQHQKKLQINLKIASVIQRASNNFKKIIEKRKDNQFSLEELESLHNVYILKQKENSLMNKKLIEMLGPEINHLFETSNQIKEQNRRIVKHAKEKIVDIEKSRAITESKIIYDDQNNQVDIIEQNINQDKNYLKTNLEIDLNNQTILTLGKEQEKGGANSEQDLNQIQFTLNTKEK